MSGLLLWRQRFGIAEGVAAAVLGISPALYARIEADEVEPEPELALRIHVLTAGDVPASIWATVRTRLLDDQFVDGGLALRAIGARQADGRWGVNLYIGAEPIARLTAINALLFAAEMRQAAELAGAPPDPITPPPDPALLLERAP